MVRMVATSYPGDNGTRPPTVATTGEILKQHGYLTAYFGKSHEVPPWEVSVSGPFDHWPARTGFEKFYGYIGGEQSSLNPQLIDGTTRLPIPRDPNYHFNTDMPDKAIAWMQATRSLTPDRPFLIYCASSGGHPPHTPPKAWLDRDLYKGEFNQGWDQLRAGDPGAAEANGDRSRHYEAGREPRVHQEMGDALGRREESLLPQMEVYATLVESSDHEVGRLVDAIDELGVLDNTIIAYIAGDNGGSSIGEINGMFMEWSSLNDAPEDIPYQLSRLDEYGRPKFYPNYSAGWAVAGSTPATWYIFMSHAGGNMAGAVVHWPKGIKAKGEKHRQSTSEVVGNRSIYHDGWLAAVVHVEPWYQEPCVKDFAQDTWELYNMQEDWVIVIFGEIRRSRGVARYDKRLCPMNSRH